MPLVRISLRSGKTAQYKRAIADGVLQALTEVFNIPEADRFQVIDERSADDLIFDPSYLGIERTADIVILQLVVSVGRDAEKKQALYRRIVELLAQKPGVRAEDVFIAVTEIAKENWSFGNGVAQYAAAAGSDRGVEPSAEIRAYVQKIHKCLDGRDPIEVLGATLPTLERLLNSADARLHTATSKPGTWCVREILAHMADAETVLGFRVRQIAAENGAAIQAYSQDKWATLGNYISIPVEDSVSRLAANRHANLALLRSLTADQLQNYGLHSERGRETVLDTMRLWAGHDINHLQQIESLLGR